MPDTMMLTAAILVAGLAGFFAGLLCGRWGRTGERTDLAASRAENRQFESRLQELTEERDRAREKAERAEQGQHAAEKSSEASRALLQEAQKQREKLEGGLQKAAQEQSELHRLRSDLIAENARLQSAQEEREASHRREVQAFDKQKEELTQRFKALASEILTANTKSLRESSQITLTSAVEPFRKSMESFKKEMQEMHHREAAQQGAMKKELDALRELNQRMTTETHELSTALRGQKKLQGNWGELALENILERSGLIEGQDYRREVSVQTEDGRKRPDAVVYLPQDKHLIIDAKVSLNAYTRYVNSEDEQERRTALAEHVRAMNDRVRELASRDYHSLPGMNTPDVVFMFVPIESAFIEAMKADDTLFQTASKHHVLVATPTTLLVSLNIVRQLWRYERQNKHMAELAQTAEGVFNKLNSFLSSFADVKKGLDRASNAYSQAEGQLISGRGNLVKKAGEFKNLVPAIRKELPEYFVDKANLELEYSPAEETKEDKES